MIIDIIFLVLLVMAVIKGWRRGLVIAVFSVIALVVGLAAALKLSTLVAAWLKDSTSISAQWLPLISFAIVFIAVTLLVRLGANMIEATMEMALLGWINKLGGIIIYVVLYTLVYSVLLFFAAQMKLLNENTIAQSVVYPPIQPWGPWVMDGLGKLIPIFKDMFTELEDFFAGLAARAA